MDEQDVFNFHGVFWSRFTQLLSLDHFLLQKQISHLKKERLVCDSSHSRGTECSCCGTDDVWSFRVLCLVCLGQGQVETRQLHRKGGGAWFFIHFMPGQRGGAEVLMQHAADFWFA